MLCCFVVPKSSILWIRSTLILFTQSYTTHTALPFTQPKIVSSMTSLEMLRHPVLLIYFKHLARSYLLVCRKTKFIFLFWSRPLTSLRLKHIYICIISCSPALFLNPIWFRYGSKSNFWPTNISSTKIQEPREPKSFILITQKWHEYFKTM